MWEYKVESKYAIGDEPLIVDSAEMILWLSEKSAGGWELVSVIFGERAGVLVFFFKRPMTVLQNVQEAQRYVILNT